MTLPLTWFLLTLIIVLLAVGGTNRAPEPAASLAKLGAIACALVLFAGSLNNIIAGTRLRWLTRLWMQRKRDNQCLRCGYDLRASPDRCPECGHAPAKSVTGPN